MGNGNASAKRCLICVFVSFAVTVLLIVLAILVGLSLNGIHYYEYGFVKSRTTGEVDTSTLYETGLYALGPSKDFITFQADAHFVHLEDLSCGTKSGNEIKMTVDFQYLLSKDGLKDLYAEYNEDYDDVIEASATEALKQTTVQFENLEFMRQRDRIEEILYQAVRDRIHDNCCPSHCQSESEDQFCHDCEDHTTCTDRGLYVHLYALQLGEISLPEDLQERFLNALLLQAKSEEAALSKNVTVIDEETKVLVNVIENEASEIRANASAQATFMKGSAEAEARSLVEQARIDALTRVLHALNLTQPGEMSYFNYYTRLNQMKNKDVSINFDYAVAAP